MEEDEKDNDHKFEELTRNLDMIDNMASNVINNSISKGLFENRKIKQIFTNVLKKPVKNISSIDKNTIVYQLPGTGETKYKNYDKITLDIKKVEIGIRKENEKKKKKLESKNFDYEASVNENLLMSDNYEEEKEIKKNVFNLEEYNIIEVIQKFKMLPEKRTIGDLYITKNYLFHTKLAEYYLNEFNNDKKIVENLITFYGLEFRYKKFLKGETIFKIGDMADNFYSILLGKIDQLKLLPKIVNMSGCEYFYYINDLIKNKEFYRFKLCMSANNTIYPIYIEDEAKIPYIYLHYILKDIYDGNRIDNLKDLFKTLNINPKEIGLDANKLTNDYINDNYKIIKKKFPRIPEDKIIDYKFFNDKIIKRTVKIFDYNKFISFESLDYFGEFAIENNTTRNGTMICSEDTEVIYINNKLYINNILTKKAIILERKTAFLSKNYLFDKIPQKKFEKRYFSWFIFETLHRGDILYKENDKLEYVYFIKQGNFKIITSKSILELEILINEISKKIKIVQNLFNNNNNDLIPETEHHYLNYNNVTADCPELLEHINKTEKLQLFILKEGEVIGLESYLLGLDHINTCIVNSIQAKIYKIDIKYLTEIFNSEKNCFYELIDRVENKLKIYRERLYEINNTKLSLTDQKIIEEKNIQYQREFNDNKNITSLSPNNKIDFNFNKLKDVISYKNNISANINYKNLRQNNFALTLPNLNNKMNNVSKNIYDSYLNLSKDKNMKKMNNLKGTFYSTSQINNKTYSNSISRLNTYYDTKNSVFLNNNLKSNLPSEKEIIDSLKRKQKIFLYEKEFLALLKNDFNKMLKEKLLLTRPKEKSYLNKANSTQSFSQLNINNKNNTLSLTQNNNETIANMAESIENNNISELNTQKLLLTQIDNFNLKMKSNNKFMMTENLFQIKNRKSKEILNKNKTNSNSKNELRNQKISSLSLRNELIRENSFKIKKNKLQKLNNINNNNFNHKSNNNIFNYSKSVNKHNKRINHPYRAPLTLIKLKKYKMITEKDKFNEDKKRYEINQKLKYQVRGLNQFGYPMHYNKRLFTQYNIQKEK